MKRGILILAMLLVSISLVSALDGIDITVDSIDKEITTDGSARIAVTIKNNLDTIETFKVYTPVTWKSTEVEVKVYPNKEETAIIEVSPTSDAKVGMINRVPVKIKDRKTDEIIEKEAMVFLRSGSGNLMSDYEVAVDIDASIPDKIDPRDKLIFTVVVDNLNPLNLSNMKLVITSNFAKLNTEQDFSVNPLGKKSIDIAYDLNPVEAPNSYDVEMEIFKDGKSVEKLQKKAISIIEIRPPYKETVKKTDEFMKTTADITYTSQSNVPDTQKVKIPVTTIKSWFTKVYPHTQIVKENGQKAYTWEIALTPGKASSITVVRDYRMILYILIVIVAMMIVYAYYASPVKIRKSITNVQMVEGGISQLKVMLEIKNTAKKSIKHVTITDYIPNIADIDRQFVEGTAKPDKVLRHKSKGSVLKWEIEEIVPGEDRLISYTIKSRLSITGNFTLPRAKVEFNHDKRQFFSYSNTTGVNA